jgi:DNA-binding transcriptional regulator YiaG
MLVYVDDLTITKNNQMEIELIKKNLKQKFVIKDLEKLKYLFGIEIAHLRKELFLAQRNMFLTCLRKQK